MTAPGHQPLPIPSPAEAIDAVLPQTQCTKCGYQGCRPYAQAIADGSAGINRCPPGGAAGITLLAALTGLAEAPLDPACGTEQALRVAWIDESLCIGCTLCIQACPVDAIVGAAKLMHTVVAPLCTGCDLCVAPCPVDCIRMLPGPGEWTRRQADAARARFKARAARLEAQAATRRDRMARQAEQNMAGSPEAEARKALVRAAMERARARQANLSKPAAREGDK